MAIEIKPNLVTSLIAGAAAGVVVDLTLFPLDTLKTRLQSKAGFAKTGGFKGVYKGISAVLIGSAPTSAFFFMTYNTVFNELSPTPWRPVIAASIAEFVAASIRVPIEVVKQRKQVSLGPTSSWTVINSIWRQEGVRGIYRGFASTLSREIPFGCVQYPLWEWLKNYTQARESWQIGLCGAAAGGIAGFLTTPMDVIKTRVILAERQIILSSEATGLHLSVVSEIYKEKGLVGFLSGAVPRVLWITVGGFIYFGVYGKVSLLYGT